MRFDAKQVIRESDFKALLNEIAVAGDMLTSSKREKLRITIKDDGSSQTQFDTAVEKCIKEKLATLTPTIPVLSEEASKEENETSLATPGYLWVMDPIDGTQSFIDGYDEYTINLALLSPPSDKPPHNRTPLLGITYAPAKHEICFTDLDGYAKQATIQPTPKKREKHGLFDSSPCVVSASARLPLDGKTLYVATGHRPEDLSIFGTKHPVQDYGFTGAYRTVKTLGLSIIGASLFTHEAAIWDVAAIDAIMRAAGGRVMPIDPAAKTITGTSIYYGPDVSHHHSGVLFNAGPYVAMNPKLALELGMKTAPGVTLPLGEGRGRF